MKKKTPSPRHVALIRLSVQLILGDVLLATPHRLNEKDCCRVMTMLIRL
jgi:hypothetical protein